MIKPGPDPDLLQVFFLNPYPTLFLIKPGKTRPIKVGPGRAKIAIPKHEELVWLTRNLKLDMTKYSWLIYGPGGFTYSGDDDDDDDGGGDLEATPSYQPRKRHFQ